MGQKNTYLKALPDGSLRFDAYECSDWEKFTMEMQPEGTFALKTFHEKYVCMQDNVTMADRDAPGGWEKFTWAY
jgi:hypothetical protein